MVAKRVRIKGPEVLGSDKIEKNSFERIVFLKKKHFIYNFLQKKPNKNSKKLKKYQYLLELLWHYNPFFL
jgi:hypothetical protein